jgi:GNAT superfamily N-acetyltransferase
MTELELVHMSRAAVSIRGLRESDLSSADRIMRLAFGTFLGLPDPGGFMGDADYVRTRWAADPAAALAAELDGRLVGTNFLTRWGSVGFFGPLTVEPGMWDRGVGRALLDATMELLDGWGLTHAGLFTFGHSPKHVNLYQSYGFWPRFLTAVLVRPLDATSPQGGGAAQTAGGLPDLDAVVADAGRVTAATFEGLDLGREIRATAAGKLGDTVLVPGQHGGLDAFAVCHTGPGSEAGSGSCFIKFGAALPGPGAAERFGRLLDACETFAAQRGLGTICAGVNTARRGAYRALLERGYRTQLIGVTMHRPDGSAYHDETAWVIDDWR